MLNKCTIAKIIHYIKPTCLLYIDHELTDIYITQFNYIREKAAAQFRPASGTRRMCLSLFTLFVMCFALCTCKSRMSSYTRWLPLPTTGLDNLTSDSLGHMRKRCCAQILILARCIKLYFKLPSHVVKRSDAVKVYF